MPVSGRPPRPGSGSETLEADWLLSEIGDVSRAPTSTFVQQLRLLRELRSREWQAPLLTPLFEAQVGGGPNSPPCPFLNPPGGDTPGTNRDTTSEDELGPSDVYMGDYSMPQPCSFLGGGTEFHGEQRCTKDMRGSGHPIPENSGEPWRVSVQIQCYSAELGYVCGIMKANVSPQSPVVTFWEGEIVDNENHTFYTNKWHATHATDLDYWHKFRPFPPLRHQVLKQQGHCGHLRDYPYIFMRWKEKFFISKQEDNQLTIQGFYYICLSRQDGTVWGYYYDPESQPYQELKLQAHPKVEHGFGFSNFQLR